jgi:hypothetical protein
LNVRGVNDVRQTKIHTGEPQVPELSALEVEKTIIKLTRHKSPGFDQISAELVKAGVRTISCEIIKLIYSVCNKEEFPEEWKGSIIVPIYLEGDKTDYNNYKGISLLSTTYRSLFNIPLSGLTPCAEEIIGDRLWGYQHNRSSTDHIFCI